MALLLTAVTACGNANQVAGVAAPAGATSAADVPNADADPGEAGPTAPDVGEEPPVDESPTEEPPAEDPTTEESPVEEPPVEEPPTPESPSSEGTVRYFSMGDSLTEGAGTPDPTTEAFPAVLAENWREQGCGVELLNVGVSGSTVAQIIEYELPQLADFAPNIVTFQSGGNDIAYSVTPEEYRANLDTVFDAVNESGARLLVFAQNHWDRSPEGLGYGPQLTGQREAMDEVLIDEASSHGGEFIDLRPLYKEQADQELWVEDGLHPTPEAYAAWADAIAEAVPAPCQ